MGSRQAEGLDVENDRGGTIYSVVVGNFDQSERAIFKVFDDSPFNPGEFVIRRCNSMDRRGSRGLAALLVLVRLAHGLLGHGIVSRGSGIPVGDLGFLAGIVHRVVVGDLSLLAVRLVLVLAEVLLEVRRAGRLVLAEVAEQLLVDVLILDVALQTIHSLEAGLFASRTRINFPILYM